MQPGDKGTAVVVRDGVKVEIEGTVRRSDAQVVIIEQLRTGELMSTGTKLPDLLRTAQIPRKDIMVWYSDWMPLPP